MRVFTAIPFSPWSEKARWALDHHQIDYREAPFMPVFGEFALRFRMRKPFGAVTVPNLHDGSPHFHPVYPRHSRICSSRLVRNVSTPSSGAMPI